MVQGFEHTSTHVKDDFLQHNSLAAQDLVFLVINVVLAWHSRLHTSIMHPRTTSAVAYGGEALLRSMALKAQTLNPEPSQCQRLGLGHLEAELTRVIVHLRQCAHTTQGSTTQVGCARKHNTPHFWTFTVEKISRDPSSNPEFVFVGVFMCASSSNAPMCDASPNDSLQLRISLARIQFQSAMPPKVQCPPGRYTRHLAQDLRIFSRFLGKFVRFGLLAPTFSPTVFGVTLNPKP